MIKLLITAIDIIEKEKLSIQFPEIKGEVDTRNP
jgi:hypothetical protein